MNFFRHFPRSFWVSNFTELFERLSYYGMYSVLALYLTGAASEGCLGFSKESTGVIMCIYTLFLYMLPIFGGALAERYGYRKAFIFALVSLSLGYFLLGHQRVYFGVFASLMIISVGGAVFKPTLTGTISKTTNADTSAMGFGIYYMIVNIGGCLGPVVASILRGFNWNYVFMASSLWVFLMLFPTLFLYREPETPGEKQNKTEGIGQVLKDSLLVVANWRFMLLILIYSGFWTVFFQLFFTMTLCLRDYASTVPILEAAHHLFPGWQAVGQRLAAVAAGEIRPGEAVNPELFTGIGAGTIIVFQLVVSRISKLFRPLVSMTGGILLAGCAMFIAGSSLNPWLLGLSIVILAFGEMAASPKFLEYVGSIAPRDKVALFLGYGFLPIGIGNALANLLGGQVYGALDAGLITISMAWFVYGGVAVATALLLLLYNRYLAPDLALKEKPGI